MVIYFYGLSPYYSKLIFQDDSIFSHATLCCQWYETGGRYGTSIYSYVLLLATQRSMGENAFHMVFQERWVFSHSSPNPALAATRLWAGYGELMRENWKTMWNAYLDLRIKKEMRHFGIAPAYIRWVNQHNNVLEIRHIMSIGKQCGASAHLWYHTHSGATGIGRATCDQKIPCVCCFGVDMYQWCLTGLSKDWWCAKLAIVACT